MLGQVWRSLFRITGSQTISLNVLSKTCIQAIFGENDRIKQLKSTVPQ